jgi:hypothetical protein
MTQIEKQKQFMFAISRLRRAVAFADAMASEQVTKETASTLRQLTHEAHEISMKFHRVMWHEADQERPRPTV